MEPLTIRVIGVPMDLGQSRRGVDMGPSAVRYAGLQSRLARLGHVVRDEGNLHVPAPEQDIEDAEGGEGARRLGPVARVCQAVYDQARGCVEAGDFALFLGGDHSMSIGTVSALACTGQRVGMIWIDAHGDFNTPATSPSGNVHGMPVAVLVGDGPAALVDIGSPGAKLQPSDIVQVGIRDLDAAERIRLSESAIDVFTMRHVDEMGIAHVARQALDRMRHVDRIHVSLDMDSLDPDDAPGVGTPVPGGLTYREAHLLMEILSDSGKVRSLDLVEINPILDTHNRTAELAVDLVASLLGQRIF